MACAVAVMVGGAITIAIASLGNSGAEAGIILGLVLFLVGGISSGVEWVQLLLIARKLAKETRCRKCQYILRGLSEPRCPECGEVI